MSSDFMREMLGDDVQLAALDVARLENAGRLYCAAVVLARKLDPDADNDQACRIAAAMVQHAAAQQIAIALKPADCTKAGS